MKTYNSTFGKSVLLCLFAVISSTTFGQLLPRLNKNQWVLSSKNTELHLDEQFRYIDNFDCRNYGIFIGFKTSGIIDQSGKICYENKGSLVSHDFGFFSENKKKLIYFIGNKKHEKDFEVQKDYGVWLEGKDDSGAYIIHKPSAKIINTSEAYTEVVNNYLLISTTRNYLYHPDGFILDSVDVYEKNYNPTDKYFVHPFKNNSNKGFLWFGNKIQIVITDKGHLHLTHEDEIKFNQSTIKIKGNKITSLFSKTHGQIVFSTESQDVNQLSKSVYLITKNNKVGLVSDKGNLLIQPKYRSLQYNQHYTIAFEDNLCGLYDVQFNKIIACHYTRILPKYNFFYTEKHGSKGLISRQTNQVLLEPIFDKIVIQENKIKAWLGNTMKVLIIDENHKIESEYVLTNVIPHDRKQFNDSDLKYDRRLENIGWFFESDVYTQSTGNANHRLKWGIKNERDSVILKPALREPIYLHNAPFSLIPNSDTRKKFYQAINIENGALIKGLKILDIDTNDFQLRNFARFSTLDHQFGVISRNGTYQIYDYVDRSDAPILRVCKAEKCKYESKKVDSINVEMILNEKMNDINIFGRIEVKNFWQHYVQFINAAWNYIDENGNPIYKKDFHYAFPFVGSNAIVVGEKGYGLVNQDSIVIEPIYRNIKREIFNGDTLFVVEYFNNIDQLYTVEGNELRPTEWNDLHVLKQTPNHTLLNSGNRKFLVDKQAGVISDKSTFVKLFDNSYYSLKFSKRYIIYDSDGHEVGSSSIKPHDVLNDHVLVHKKNNKFELYSTEGIKLSNQKYSGYHAVGELIVMQKNTIQGDVFNTEGKLLNADVSHILIDPISNQYCHLNKKRLLVKNGQGAITKRLMLVNDEIVGFVDNKLFFKKRPAFDLNINQPSNIFIDKTQKINALGDEFLVVSDYSGKSHLRKISGEPMDISEVTFKHIEFLSNEVLAMKTGKGFLLYHTLTKDTLRVFDYFDHYQDGLLCVKLVNSRYAYLDSHLNNHFDATFLNAKPFKSGKGTVNLQSGWGIIDLEGKPITVPCLPEIKMMSNNLVFVHAQSQFGLFDKNGQTLIPVGQNALYFNKNYIRTHHNGSILYWDARFNKI